MKTDQDTPTDKENEITETIEEIALDDTTRSGEANVIVDEDNEKACFNCGYRMIEQKACMLKCINCGAVKDCSETAIW